MKRFFSLFFILILTFILSIPAFAVETEVTPVESTLTIPDVNVYVTNEIPSADDLGEYVGTSVYAMNPVRASDANGFKQVMLEVIGDYDAIVVEHQYEGYNGSINYVREIQYDFPWLCSCALFAIVLFCILRGGFAVLCKL